MARVVGPVPADPSERAVLRALKEQCPTDWVIVSDVRWALQNGSYVRSGQADVVVLVPNSGMVVLEVKGSRRIVVEDDGQWYRFERRNGLDAKVLIDEPPPAQAQRNMHSLVEVTRNSGYRQFPGRFTFMAVYPQGAADRLPPMFDESTLATYRHMGNLPARIRHALERAGDSRVGEGFSADVIASLAKTFANVGFTVTHVDTEDQVADDIQKIEQLTRQQFAVLRGLFDYSRVSVVGPAGSGKTLLAIWRLQALLESGKRAAFVCFNKKLAESLRSRYPDAATAILRVDELFMRLSPGPVPSGVDVGHYLKVDLAERIFDLATTLPPNEKYDALVIDEGQDFSVNQIMALQELLAPDGTWAIFSDRRQDLFRAGAGDELGGDVAFRLEYNCRNTVRVNEATNAYVASDRPIQSMEGMPRGERPALIHCGGREQMANEAWKLASMWATEKGVAILSPFTLQNSCMARSLRGHGLELTEELSDLGKPGKVYFSTIRSFKGVEAPAVIVVDVRTPDEDSASPFRAEDLYVACTRPTARLGLLSTDEATIDWLKQRSNEPIASSTH
jgi:hypothetical protein